MSSQPGPTMYSPLLSSGGHVDHRSKLLTRDLPVSVSISSLETFPGEPVDLLVRFRVGVTNILAVFHKCVFVKLKIYITELILYCN